jgi:hypothetical protein
MAAIEGMIPGAEKLPSALPGDGKQGQFDLVYRGPDGTIYIVESKGGSAELGTKKGKDREGNDVDLQQGSELYLDAIVANMKEVAIESGDAELWQTADDIENAKNNGTLVYLHASQKIGPPDGKIPDLNITNFDVGDK